jgi:LPXTG-motif cell wall-anchored protein
MQEEAMFLALSGVGVVALMTVFFVLRRKRRPPPDTSDEEREQVRKRLEQM